MIKYVTLYDNVYTVHTKTARGGRNRKYDGNNKLPESIRNFIVANTNNCTTERLEKGLFVIWGNN